MFASPSLASQSNRPLLTKAPLLVLTLINNKNRATRARFLLLGRRRPQSQCKRLNYHIHVKNQPWHYSQYYSHSASLRPINSVDAPADDHDSASALLTPQRLATADVVKRVHNSGNWKSSGWLPGTASPGMLRFAGCLILRHRNTMSGSRPLAHDRRSRTRCRRFAPRALHRGPFKARQTARCDQRDPSKKYGVLYFLACEMSSAG